MSDMKKDEFLKAFKDLEDVLRQNGYGIDRSSKGSLAQYEDTLPEDSDFRRDLCQCRIMRNRYQHENNVLFLPTQDAIDLLNDTMKKMDKRKMAKDLIKRSQKILDTDIMQDKLTDKDISFIISGGVIPVVTASGEYAGCIDSHAALLIFSLQKKRQIKFLLKDEVVKNLMQFAADTVHADDFAADLQDDKAYVVFDKKNKYKGMIQKSCKQER